MRKLTVYKALLLHRAFAAESMRTSMRVLNKGQLLVQQGAHVRFLYTIRRGWAYRYSVSRDGRRQILSLLQPGDFVGLAEIEQERWSHSVRTFDRVTVCEFPRDIFLRQMLSTPDAFLDMARNYADAQRESDEIAMSLGSRSALERLAHFILLLQRRVARHSPNQETPPREFKVPMRRDDLADLLGMTPVHVSRSLGKLAKMGVLTFNRGAITISDEEILRGLAAA